MEDAIRQGIQSLREGKTHSAAEVHSRVAAWITRQFIPRGGGSIDTTNLSENSLEFFNANLCLAQNALQSLLGQERVVQGR